MTTNPNGFSLVITCSHDLLSSSGQPNHVHEHDIRLVNLTNLGWEASQMLATGRRIIDAITPEWRKPAFMLRRETLTLFGAHLEKMPRLSFHRIEPERMDTGLTSQADLGLVYLLSAIHQADPTMFVIKNGRVLCRVGEDEDLVIVQYLRQKPSTVNAPKNLISATEALNRGRMKIRREELSGRR